tara:strand:- start:452 stop:1117 length:666 start_codon:yes stop_codon:yes gene_type:complete
MAADLKVTNLKHASSSSNNLVLASDGSATTTLSSTSVVPASIGASVVHLNTTTISSAVGDVQFNNTLITTTYDYYVVIMQGVSSSADNFDLYAHLSIDNGSSKVSHRSACNYHKLNGTTAEGWTQHTDHLIWEDGEGDLSGGSGGGFAVFELLISPQVVGVDASTRSWGAVQNQNGDFYGYTTTGIVTTSSSSARINHLKFDEVNDNNIDAGKFSLYAYKL